VCVQYVNISIIHAVRHIGLKPLWFMIAASNCLTSGYKQNTNYYYIPKL